MKKKLIGMLLAGVVVLNVTGCQKAQNPVATQPVEATTQAGTVPAVTIQEETTTVQTATESTTISEEELNHLIQENLYCMRYVFELGSLPVEGDFVEGQWIYPVKEDIFKSYEEFENYVRSVYCKNTADRYLYNYPYEGTSKYLNVDGKLYENRMYDGGKGYYVDWDNYTITIDSSSATECEFTVNCTVEWPADKPVKEPYPVKGKVLLEDGKWVLEKVLY